LGAKIRLKLRFSGTFLLTVWPEFINEQMLFESIGKYGGSMDEVWRKPEEI
jgi:hypothetical protein